MTFFSRIFKRKVNGSFDKPKTEMAYILERAESLSQQTNRAFVLHDLQKLVMRPVQSIHMLDAYIKCDHRAVDGLDGYNCFGLDRVPDVDIGFVEYLWNHCRLPAERAPSARLGSDVVLPTPWHPFSVLNSLGNFGEHRGGIIWKQDQNHSLSWWFPLNIFWVHGGNHSITQGILNAEGNVKAQDAYDLTPLYQYIKFDGESWRDIKTNAFLGNPRHKEIGYAFEIGRYLILK